MPSEHDDVLLIRHGRSSSRTAAPHPLLDGQGDPPLSPLGYVQAEAVLR